MRHPLLSLWLVLLLLPACVAYHPAPIAPASFEKSYSERAALLPADAIDEPKLLAFAIGHAPRLRDAAAAYRVALAAARSARIRPLGTLTLTAEYSHQDNPNKPWLGNGSASIPLDMGARRSGRIDSADLAALQARYDYVEALWTVRTAIARGLTEWRAADAELVIDGEAVAIRREREARFERRVAAGEDARSMQLFARTDRLAAEKRLSDAEGRRAQAIETIGAAIGVPGSALALHPITAIPVETADPMPGIIATWRSEAALARPDVLRAIADYDIAEAALRTEVARQYPDIQLGPGYTYERGITKLPFTLSLALPPADFNRAAIHEAEARRAAAGFRLEGVQANVVATVDAARATLEAARLNQLRALRGDLPVAERNFAQLRRSSAAGEVDKTDLLAAQGALIDTQVAAIETRRVHDLARADLDAAARPPLSPEETMLFDQAMQSLEPKK